jgi:hypothetical protein
LSKKTICRFFAAVYRILLTIFYFQVYFWNRIIEDVMKNKDHFLERHKEHHPQVGIGLFLIVLGLALLVATNDLLGLGSVKDYFTWKQHWCSSVLCSSEPPVHGGIDTYRYRLMVFYGKPRL